MTKKTRLLTGSGYGTQANDLSPLKDLTNLEWLGLDATPVKDLSPLKGMTKLESLDLQGTKVSKEKVLELQKALPNCSIYSKSE